MKEIEGHTEEQIIKLITKLAKRLSYKFTFGYYDRDDIFQEAFIIGMDAIEKFDKKKAKHMTLESFVRVHMKRRLMSLKRDKMERIEPPCKSCKSFSNGKCVKNDGKANCAKWQNWQKRNDTKRALIGYHELNCPAAIIDLNLAFIDDKAANDEIIDYVSQNIPSYMRSDFLRFIEGESISVPRKNNLLQTIQDLVQSHPDYDDLVD